ncbi:MAG: metallopeptidase [Candidatus Diapherotrites archaeon]|nr:metallopeptidase [Candidatus Diapherotrites archaeon]
MKWEKAQDVKELVEKISTVFPHIRTDRVFCVRSEGSKSRAIARIWAMGKAFQVGMGMEAAYVIEAVSERFDGLAQQEKELTIVHELMHVPKTFSGALVPHKCFGKRINRRSVEKKYKEYQSAKRNTHE